MVSDSKPYNTILLLTSAVLMNSVAGLLYVWSLFILPIEDALNIGRASTGLISSISLICFTLGVSFLASIVERIGRVSLAISSFCLISFGHLLFGLFPSWSTLIIGYGACFGFGSGLAYGFALHIVASLPSRIRAMSIGLAMGSFALSGIMLPLFLDDWIAITDSDAAFLRIGLVVLVVGLLCVGILVRGISFFQRIKETNSTVSKRIFTDKPFLILSVIFFLLCFTGLAVVSQAAAMGAAAGIAAAGLATTSLTIGYLTGSLLGASIAQRIGELWVILLMSVLSFFGVMAMLSEAQLLMFAGSAFIGLTFGGVASRVARADACPVEGEA